MNPERQNGSDPEKKLSEEEAEKLLKVRPDIPGIVRSFLGHENVRDLVQIVMSQDAFDLDMVFLTGRMTEEELAQYTKVLPEFDEKKEKILAVLERMMAKFKVELSRCRNSDALRETMRSGLNSVVRLNNIMIVKDRMAFRNGLMGFFHEVWMFMIFEAFKEYVLRHKTSGNVTAYNDIFLEAEQNSKTDRQVCFKPGVYLNEKKYAEDQLKNPVYGMRLAAITGLGAEAGKAGAAEELKAGLGQILELAQYRKITFTVFRFQDTEIAIMGEDMYGESNRTGFRQTCAVEICLDARQKARLPEPVIAPDGEKTCFFRDRPGVIQFVVNRANGELCFPGHQTKPISCIMSGAQYQALKKTVYSLILHYLKSKEPDIDDLFLKSDGDAGIASSRAQTAGEVARVVKDDGIGGRLFEDDGICVQPIDVADEQLPVSSDLPAWTYTAWQAPPRVVKGDAEPEAAEISEAAGESRIHERNYSYIERLKGLKGGEVLAILKRLLGEPVRIRGSHHIFFSPKNGATFPIPIHASESVKFPLLLASLKKWGITLETFCREI